MTKYSQTDIVRELRRLYNKRGSAPSQSYMTEHSDMSYHTVMRRFGSFNKGVEAAGIEPNPDPKTQPLTDADIAFDLQCGTEFLGHPPSSREYALYGTHSRSIIIDKYGSWKAALEMANLWDDYITWQKEQGNYDKVVVNL